PCFSGDGKYLFFVSGRDFNPIYSTTEWNHAYRDMSRIYVALLAKGTPSPFRTRGEDEDKPAAKGKDAKKDKDKKEAKPATKDLKVDLDDIEDRILQLPVQAANYRNLQSVGGSVYYMRQRAGAPPGAFVYDLATRKETSLGPINGFEISADGKKML